MRTEVRPLAVFAPRMLTKYKAGPVNQIHGSSNTIHVLRTKIRVLFVFKSLNTSPPLYLAS